MTQLTKREQIAFALFLEQYKLYADESVGHMIKRSTLHADAFLKHLEETEPDLKPKEEEKSELLTKDQRAECEKVMNLDCVKETIELLKGILSDNHKDPEHKNETIIPFPIGYLIEPKTLVRLMDSRDVRIYSVKSVDLIGTERNVLLELLDNSECIVRTRPHWIYPVNPKDHPNHPDFKSRRS
jgi:hypothetical protein